MKIFEVIDNVKRLKKGCEITDEQIIADINKVEATIILNICKGREEGDYIESAYGNYDISTSRDEELLAPAPYDTIYQEYCCSQIDLQYEDSERWQNDSIIFNNTYKELRSYWFRTHRQTSRHEYHT